MKISKTWCESAAKREGDAEVGVGMQTIPAINPNPVTFDLSEIGFTLKDDGDPDETHLCRYLAERDEIISNVATMLRRMICLVERHEGDTSLKVIAGKARQLLAKYGLQGNILR